MTQPYPGSAEFHAARTPEKIAFHEGGREVSWQAFDAAASRLAAGMLGLGFTQGQRIAVMTGVRHEWFIIHLAASKIGAALVGINARATLEEAGYMLEDSGATGLILDHRTPDDLIRLARAKGIERFLSFHAATDEDVPVLARLIAPEGPVPSLVSAAPAPLILYTSGTTGRPKGVALDPALLASRKDAMAYRDTMARLIPVSETSRFLLNLPLHHAAGPNSALFCLRAGGCVVVQPKFDAAETLALIEQHGVTNWMAVPTMVHRLKALPEEVRENTDRRSMRVLNIGAAAVPVELKAWALDYFGAECLVFEGYGMSETQMISYMLPGDWAVAPNSSGKPMPYVDVKILAPDGAELGPGEKGEICARTPFTIDRYLNRPPLGPDDLTPDGFFRTGDVGYLDALGYLYVTDRIKDMIIVGGMNVYPAEVEAVLATHPDIVEAAVIGIPDPDLGEQVVAFCELRSGSPERADHVIAHCRESLAAFKVPRSVRFVADLPRNATGKVTKNVLRAPFWKDRDRKV
jgi:long-chain acyl-CoA synthetase